MSLTNDKQFNGDLFSIALRRSLIVSSSIHFVVFWKHNQVAHGVFMNHERKTIGLELKAGYRYYSVKYENNVYRFVRSKVLNCLLHD